MWMKAGAVGCAMWIALVGAVGSVSAQSRDLRRLAATNAPETSWGEVNESVQKTLETEDLSRLAKEAASAPPAGQESERMRRLNLFLRAGYHRDAERLIDRLPRNLPDSLFSHTPPLRRAWADADDALYLRWQQPQLALRLLEHLPRHAPGWLSVVVDEWTARDDWQKRDRWLQKRMDGNPHFWRRLRVQLYARHGEEDRVLEPLAEDVRRHPDDYERVRAYLYAEGAAQSYGILSKPAPQAGNIRSSARRIRSLDWIGSVSRPRLAIESYELGRSLAPRSPSAAIALLTRSLAMPYTEEDADWYTRQRNEGFAIASPFLKTSEATLRGWTKQALAEVYQASGQSAMAQPLLEEITAQYKDGLPSLYQASLAGQVQAGSGQRVIENRIKEAEPENKDSVAYWQARGGYYMGRKENDLADEAYRKALALAAATLPQGPTPCRQVAVVAASDPRQNEFTHIQVMSDYSHFIFVTQSKAAVVNFLQSELATAKLDSEYARYLVQDMDYYEDDNSTVLVAGNERLWAFLAARSTWGPYGTESRLLRRWTVRVAPEKRDAIWKRAEALVKDEASRAFALGEAMTMNDASERALPLLRLAVEKLPADATDRSSALSVLFHAYCDQKDWKAAEALLPLYGKTPDSFLLLAETAAKADALDDAFRLWKEASRTDRNLYGDLAKLARLGLKSRLQAYYRLMQKDEPASDIAAKALKLLE